MNEHRERRKLIRPVEPTWEQQLAEWISEEYKGKGFREDMPVILSEKGERVRSKSEKILADYFYRNQIPYKYERPLYLKNFGTVHPDFTFLSRKTRQEIYWEHDGKWMIRFMRKMLSGRFAHMKKTVFTPENV